MQPHSATSKLHLKQRKHIGQPHSLKRSLTRLAPWPTKISSNSGPAAWKKGTLASPATARARRVLPVPGGPTRSTPAGGTLSFHTALHQPQQLCYDMSTSLKIKYAHLVRFFFQGQLTDNDKQETLSIKPWLTYPWAVCRREKRTFLDSSETPRSPGAPAWLRPPEG